MRYGLRWIGALATGAALVLALPQAALAAPGAPIVIGTSFTGGNSDMRDFRFLHGVNAYIERINRTGGVNGRMVRMVALDDTGSRERLVANVHALVKEHGAVAILGCLTDAVCEVVGSVASELKVPLIGAMSGVKSLSRQTNPYVFRVRADYAREVEAVATQMLQMGHRHIAIFDDGSNSPELASALEKALAARSIRYERILIDREKLTQAVASLGGQYHAVLMNVSANVVDALVDEQLLDRPEWPRFLMTLSTGNLASLVGHFKGKAIGFSMVVPNPEVLVTSLARDLTRDAEMYAGPHAVTFDGMEAYVSARLLVEALRQIDPRSISAHTVFNALDNSGPWDLGGFSVSFKKGRATGSDWVQMGLRSRNGMLVN